MSITLDTETCGFHGPIVLLQWAIDDEEVQVLDVWRVPAKQVLETIDFIASQEIIGFNLAFDWFHLCQLYTTLKVYLDRWPTLKDHLINPEMYAECEPLGRDAGCLKPKNACDVMLSARKTKYQSLMDRKNIYIRDIPDDLVELVCEELNNRLPFKPIYFERSVRRESVWQIQPSKKRGFSNLYVKFAPSSRLKALAKDALGLEDPPLLASLAPPMAPLELGYAPFALAIKSLPKWKGQGAKFFRGEWKGSWVDRIEDFIDYWGFFEPARKYAKDDVIYTRELAKSFGLWDEDSELACMVGAVRWKGFKIDVEQIKILRQRAYDIQHDIPTSFTGVKQWLSKAMSPEERLGLPESTGKEALKEIMQWDEDAYEQVQKINNSNVPIKERLEALDKVVWEEEVSKRAFLVYEARHAQKEIELYDKLLIAGRFHASFKIIGTLSSRMAGADKLNAQGIKKAKYVRKAFPLAFEDFQLSGGDFSAFEVAIADAVYDEPKLREALTSETDCPWGPCERCNFTGKEKTKIHAVFGTFVFPGKSYADIRKSEGQVPDYYTLSKSGLFTWLFAGTEYAFKKNLGIAEEQARNGLHNFERAFPKIKEERTKAMEEYAAMLQEGGVGSKIELRKHKDHVATLLGFKRFFDLEYAVIETLFAIVENPPSHWDIEGYVDRRNRKQTVLGAARSAIAGSAFSLQSKIQRVAINHPIQGTGAQITKLVQRDIWNLQPHGYKPWRVIPMNIHDEIMCPNTCPDEVADVVSVAIEKYKQVVPLLKMDWQKQMSSWADK